MQDQAPVPPLAEPLTLETMSPLSQLRGLIPSSRWPFRGQQGQLSPSTALLRCSIILRCPQISLVPLDAMSPSCSVWLELPRCHIAVAQSVPLCSQLLTPCSTFQPWEELACSQLSLLNHAWALSEHNIHAFVLKLMPSPPSNKIQSWIKSC